MVPTPSSSVGDELFEEVLAALVKYRFDDVGAPLAGWTAVAPVLDEPRMLTDRCVETAPVSIDESAANLLVSLVVRGAAECRQSSGRARRRGHAHLSIRLVLTPGR